MYQSLEEEEVPACVSGLLSPRGEEDRSKAMGAGLQELCAQAKVCEDTSDCAGKAEAALGMSIPEAGKSE